MPLNQFFRAETPTAHDRPEFGYFDAVAGEAIGLARLYSVHDSSGVIAELPLSDDLHAQA
jgi:hypothetical protein